MTAIGKVYLVGAGPGDPELITARALRRLREADVVLYDALVHPDQLQHCRADAELVFVGKRGGRSSERQATINQMLVDRALAGNLVVRLKGGDPYLFGRGSEEAELLAERGVPFEVIPGVPSPLAATAYAGISLTHRDMAGSVAYVTATESPEKDRSSHAWDKLATATQTLVIFMGLRKLETLTGLLREHGRPAHTPVAVIQSASLPTQRTVVGTLEDIADRVRAAGLTMPALTVVGEVVSLREHLRWYDLKPLFGKRVLVTRPSGQAGVLSQMLRDEGAQPVEAPTIRIVPPQDPEPLRAAVSELDGYDWVVFTSRNGVDRFFVELGRQGGDARRLGGMRVAAIGPGTAAELADRGIRPDQVPDEYRGEAIAQSILDVHSGDMTGLSVLLPRAAVARDVVPDLLRAAGAKVNVVAAYQSVPPRGEAVDRLRRLVHDGGVDVVTFTASSTVTNLVELLGDGAAQALSPLTVATIGPITAQTAAEHGIRVDVSAEEYTNAGMVASLAAHVEALR